jgi:hypothetical protein
MAPKLQRLCNTLDFYAFDLASRRKESGRPCAPRTPRIARAKVMPQMEQEIRLSEGLDTRAAEVIAAVKKQGS